MNSNLAIAAGLTLAPNQAVKPGVNVVESIGKQTSFSKPNKIGSSGKATWVQNGQCRTGTNGSSSGCINSRACEGVSGYVAGACCCSGINSL